MLDVFKNRFSVREYNSEVVDEHKLTQVLMAAQSSPTWKNKQCFDIIVIDDKEIQKEIGEIVNYNPSKSAYHNASHLLIFVADPAKSGHRDEKPYYMSDTAIAIEHVILQATALNLGTCWVGVFPEDIVKAKLGIPNNLKVVAMTPLGYSNEEYQKRPRRELSEIIHKNKY